MKALPAMFPTLGKAANHFASAFSFRCPLCGSRKTVTSMTKPLPFVTDGPSKVEGRCRSCGHRWTVFVRTGI